MTGVSDPFELQRFVDAQAPVYDAVVAELRDGCKRSHWIWFVFPQLAGLGGSAMAQRYAIASLGEARAYLDHAVLGRRLRECTRLVNAVQNRSITEIFGWPDEAKVRSSMTLFARAAAADNTDCTHFQTLLDRYYNGEEDPVTVARLTG